MTLSEAEMIRKYNENIALVYSTWERYVRSTNMPGAIAHKDDIIQAGCIALMNAVCLYDPTRGYKFSTYAVSAIQNEFRREHIRLRKWERPLERPLDYIPDEEVPAVEDRLHERSPDYTVLQERVDTAIQKIPERIRNVIRGWIWEEKTLADLAREVGVCREATRKWKDRGLDMMRKDGLLDLELLVA